METPRSQTKLAMNYGAFYGLSTIIVMLVFYFAGSNMQSKWPQWIGYLLLITFMVLGIKSFRDEEGGGFISFGRSLGTGILISIFGSIITGAFTVVLFTFIAPDMTQRILEMTQQNLTEQGISEEQINMSIEWARKFMTPMWLFVFSVVGGAFMGLLFGLFISIFLRREQNNPFQSNA